MLAKVDSVSLYKVRKILSELSTKKGRGTELVSLYVPPKKVLHEVSTALREEYGTASNIKSDTTRNHVQDALTRTMQRLKLYRQAPENGLVIFCGALATNGPGSEVVSVYEVTPPRPIQTYLYRCDDHFHLDILKEMLKEEEVIGLLSIDATESGMGIVSGDRFEVVDVITSGVSGKHRAGGQSARRFERLREMELTSYFRRVARHAAKAFLEDHQIKGLIVSGPGPTKDVFLKEEHLDYRLKKMVKSVMDGAYSGREGLREALEKAGDILQDMRVVEERRLVQKFLAEVNKAEGLAVYSVNDVLDALRVSKTDKVLVSEDSGLSVLKKVCRKCGSEEEKVVRREEMVLQKQKMISESCKACSGSEVELLEEDIVDYLVGRSADSGAGVEVISSRTEEGAMLQSFGGVAALLRYR